MRVVVLRDFESPARGRMRAGDVLEAPPEEALDWLRLGFARRLPAEPEVALSREAETTLR